ncbi:MAG TPA: zinc ribbon domain-containing protein [Candidatus Limnocylindria bacterium]|nr:zinc ribbon domain-containing protein [Candidatus Limnocylindria bacterium]
MTAERFCTNCGAAQAAGAVFCVQCGTPQPPAPSAGPAVPSAPLVAPVVTPPAVVIAPAAAAATVPPPVATIVGSPSAGRIGLALPRLIALAVGVAVGVGALAVAITIALTPPGGKPGPGNGQGSGNGTPAASGDLEVVDVQNIGAQVPIAWDVVTRARDTIVVEDPASHALWLRSAPLPVALSYADIQQRFLDRARNQSPDAKVCAGPETAAVPGGPTDGQYFVICSTLVPQGGGQAVRLADAYYVGLDGAGVNVAVMQLTAVPEGLEGFATAIRALPPPNWKLFR